MRRGDVIWVGSVAGRLRADLLDEVDAAIRLHLAL
jgi:hypothetical protein